MVVRYDYLWSNDAEAHLEYGKIRPACIVATISIQRTSPFVVLLPITHRRPAGKTIGVEIPSNVRAALGLDAAPSWIVISESNIDQWPPAGLAAVPGRPKAFAYGYIPPRLFAKVKAGFRKLAVQGQSRQIRR